MIVIYFSRNHSQVSGLGQQRGLATLLVCLQVQGHLLSRKGGEGKWKASSFLLRIQLGNCTITPNHILSDRN